MADDTVQKGTSVSAVQDLFGSLEELQNMLRTRGEEELGTVCSSLLKRAEVVAECLAYHTQQYSLARSDIMDISGALWKSIHDLVPLRKEVEDLRKLSKNLQLIDSGIDPRPIELPSDTQESGRGMRQSSSYEDFKQSKQHEMGSVSGRSETASPAPSFGIRKAKSDPDVNRHNMSKELDALRVDVKRLKTSEKKLLKDTQQLGRKCKLLTEERDRAEDRLKIEQTQRDSIEKLRQRNRELEEQVNTLRQRQVIKDKEQKD